MNLNIQIPDNTALIFEYMQKGQFYLFQQHRYRLARHV